MEINNFSGDYIFLSNFFFSHLIWQGVGFNNVEAAFQASKLPKDIKKYATVFHLFCVLKASDAKALGGIIPIRNDWELVKFDIMEQLLREKFKYQPLADKLIATGNAELIEGNYWHDNTWGRCSCAKCKVLHHEQDNMLGKLLMKIRGELQHES